MKSIDTDPFDLVKGKYANLRAKVAEERVFECLYLATMHGRYWERTFVNAGTGVFEHFAAIHFVEIFNP